MTKQRMNHYKRLIDLTVNIQIKTQDIYKAYYRGMITAAEKEKELASIIAANRNNELIISCMFSVIATHPNANEYNETIRNIFSAELKSHVERMERIRMERELYELTQTLAG